MECTEARAIDSLVGIWEHRGLIGTDHVASTGCLGIELDALCIVAHALLRATGGVGSRAKRLWEVVGGGIQYEGTLARLLGVVDFGSAAKHGSPIGSKMWLTFLSTTISDIPNLIILNTPWSFSTKCKTINLLARVMISS